MLGVRPEHVRFSDTRRGERRRLRRRISRHDADRHGRDRARHGEGAGAFDAGPVAPGERVGLDFRPEKLSIFDKASGRAIRTALHEGARAMAEVRLDGVTKAFKARQGGRRPVARPSATASSSCCSARPAPARRRRCGSSRASRAPDAGASSSAARDVTREPPAVRDVAFVFQQYSLYPHLSVYDNLAFPLRSPTRRVPEAADQAARSREVARAAAHREQARQQGDASCPAARCSASPSAGRWCARPPSI